MDISCVNHLWPDLQKGFVKKNFKPHQQFKPYLYTYSCYICITILYVYKLFLKSGHKCFNRSGPFLEIRSYLLCYNKFNEQFNQISVFLPYNMVDQLTQSRYSYKITLILLKS